MTTYERLMIRLMILATAAMCDCAHKLWGSSNEAIETSIKEMREIRKEFEGATR